MADQYDIVIAGGGLAGTGLACLLADAGLRIALVEQNVPDTHTGSRDDRGLALSLASCRILEAMQVWPALAALANPIRHIHVSERGRFAKVRFHAADLGLAALGHVIQAGELGRALQTRVAACPAIDYLAPASVSGHRSYPDRIELDLVGRDLSRTVQTRLLVAADGTRSRLRDEAGIAVSVHDYGQTAIVSMIETERESSDTAWERFTPSGPLALLPLGGRRHVCVFTVNNDREGEVMALDDDAFLAETQATFGNRLGRFASPGPRRPWPLRRVIAERQVADRLVLLGNAAHTIHPNGAQGLNLALRDAAALAELLHGDGGARDPGDPAVLQAYVHMRSADQQATIRLSSGMADLYYNGDPLRGCVRGTAMLMLDLLPAAKRSMMRRFMGIAGRQPAVVRERAC